MPKLVRIMESWCGGRFGPNVPAILEIYNEAVLNTTAS